ncbi:MAG TPA: hypothetical protein ENK57_26360 [Polyangiaceae bacterium]|nr:hypothetical protein [Polyangiaceae bacterium]
MGARYLLFAIAAAVACLSASASAQTYDAQQRAALAYYAQHYPAYYQRHYGGLRLWPALTQPPPSPTSPPPVTSAPSSPEDAPPITAADVGEIREDVAGMVSGESVDEGDRTLRGHSFPYPRLVDSPFNATNLYAGTSMEMYRQRDVRSVFRGGDGEPRELRYDRNLAYLRLRYGFDLAIVEAFGVGVDADFLAEVGANSESLMLRGGQTGYVFRPRAVVRLHRSDSSQWALRGHGTISGGIRAIPHGMLQSLAGEIDAIAADPERSGCLAAGDLACALEGRGMDTSQIRRRRYGGGGALTFGHAFGRAASVQLAAGAEGARQIIETAWGGALGATQVVAYGGIAPALDFGPAFPLGITAAYRFEMQRSAYEASEALGLERGVTTFAKNHRLSGGLSYTGRRDLMLGATVGVAFLQDVDSSVLELASSPASSTSVVTEQPAALLLSGQLEMRYFF